MRNSMIFMLISSYLFRIYFQIIDFVVLDLDSYQYMDRYISLGTLYLCLGLLLKCFNRNTIVDKFQYDANEISMFSDFNELFNVFLEQHFKIYLSSLLEVIQFLSKYFCLNFDCSVPKHSIFDNPYQPQVNFILILYKVSYEEFLQKQTYNCKTLESIEKLKSI
jgi:hypothetical protein